MRFASFTPVQGNINPDRLQFSFVTPKSSVRNTIVLLSYHLSVTKGQPTCYGKKCGRSSIMFPKKPANRGNLSFFRPHLSIKWLFIPNFVALQKLRTENAE